MAQAVTLATADPHASSNPRDAYRWLFLEKTLPALVTEHGVTRILILGDLTEQKSNHSAELVNRLVDALAALTKTANVYLLKGNHDYLAEDSPFFRFTRHLPRVRWINEPTALTLRGLGDCLFLPHSRKPAEEWKPRLKESYDWYFCHQTFDGARNENGQALSGVARDIFPKSARIVSGDIHGSQKVGPITYVGAPYHVDFGNDYEPRVLLLEGAKMRSVPVAGPQKRLMTLSGRNPFAGLNMKHPLAATLQPIHAGDVLKVRIELPAGSETSRTEVRAQVRTWAEEQGVQLYAVEITAPKVTLTKAARDKHHASDADLVRAYVKKMGAGKVAIAAGLKLMEEA